LAITPLLAQSSWAVNAVIVAVRADDQRLANMLRTVRLKLAHLISANIIRLGFAFDVAG
jgi:hypothetical protein